MKIEDNKKYLMLVESPTKQRTISGILKAAGYKNITVLASKGHITRLADKGDYNIGLDIQNNFEPMYEILEDKKDLIKRLKEQVKAADHVILASDADREGEAIAYHLIQELNIPKKKCSRVTYHEITKNAILKGIENSRDLDMDLVNSALAREAVDKIIGFRLSGPARKSVGALSVGRCQSAGLKMVITRDNEITNFDSLTYFDLFLHFVKNEKPFKAKYIGTEENNVDYLSSLDECNKIIADCVDKDFIIKKINTKTSVENPKAPFITATFQQEAVKSLGLSTKEAMDCAQKLFEGLSINGEHRSIITYHRTDDAELSPEFEEELNSYIINTYGKEFFGGVKKKEKDANAQAGHEALRCVDCSLTPEMLYEYVPNARLVKVYELIWRRTLACAMKPALYNVTTYTITNGVHNFVMTSKELIFKGFKKVYTEAKDKFEADEVITEVFEQGELLRDTKLEAIEKQTQPPARYTEASLISDLKKNGIGRPSTYETIVNTLLDSKRNYCTLSNKKFVPTTLGFSLVGFLDKSFSDIINLKYTAELEAKLDLIAQGKLERTSFLKDFYNNLDVLVKNVAPSDSPNTKETKICPNCGKPMSIKKGPYGLFWGCSGYPECRTIISLHNNFKK